MPWPAAARLSHFARAGAVVAFTSSFLQSISRAEVVTVEVLIIVVLRSVLLVVPESISYSINHLYFEVGVRGAFSEVPPLVGAARLTVSA